MAKIFAINGCLECLPRHPYSYLLNSYKRTRNKGWMAISYKIRKSLASTDRRIGICPDACNIMAVSPSIHLFAEINPMQLAFKPRLTTDDYLAGELTSQIRHEYVDGEVYAMAGAGEPHNLIALNVASRLRHLVRGGPCRVFISDMKLHVKTWDAFYYPDVMVVCDAGDSQTYFKQNPSLVVEVLSPSTESIDRREKMLAYRTLPSLHEYLLIAQDKPHVELYRRADNGNWQLAALPEGAAVPLECVNASLTLDEVYEDIKFMSNVPASLMDIALTAR